ncbi:MAG TPA: GNAT family N-acetyltransferase [Oligoflexus sp.]|uniref:GNAT family N-acetyltransferase n=1 Tax=Oligoflexus sp. TaxID=1971216 RepID=UPI002D624E3A|nr:GNAT family N-acetyltransferase [Oligoflexus sp.]HYX35608.1 GNAT family N-acetyltransferase [Oligoflexus sp.]
MNIYSSDEFLHIVVEAFFSGQSWAIEFVQVRGQFFRVLVIDGKQVIGSVPFMDFLEALPAPEHPMPRKGAWLPRVSHKLVVVDEWRKGGFPHGMEASPTILWEDWREFSSFVQYAQENNSQAFSKRQKKKWGRIPGELQGSLRYEYRITKASAEPLLALLMDWKTKQYQRTGLMDTFARPRTRKFFELLLQADLLQLSGVFAGDKPLALHAGFVREGRFYFVLPAYDIEYQQYKSGQLLLESMLESSFHAGHREFDFLLGDEPYKFYYANRVRIVGPLGYRFVKDKVYAPLRRATMQIVRRQAGLYRGLQKLKRSLKERGIL